MTMRDAIFTDSSRSGREAVTRLMHSHRNGEQDQSKIRKSLGDAMGFFSVSRRMGRAAGAAAQQYCDDFDTYSPLARRTRTRRKAIPTLQYSDLVVGKLLGEGNFSHVFEVRLRPGVTLQSHGAESPNGKSKALLERRSHENGAHDVHSKKENEKKQQQQQQQHEEGTTLQEDENGNDGGITYAMKHLRPKRTVDQKKFTACAIDLVMEAKVLACLEHPNIVRIHGVAQGSISGIFSGTADGAGYFLLLDRLACSLYEKIEEWIVADESEDGPSLPRSSSSESLNNKRSSSRDTSSPKKPRGRRPSRPERESSLRSRSSTGVDRKIGLLSATNGFDQAVCERVLERLRAVMLDVTRGMEYLHRQKIVFRDLKPANVGFTFQGKIKIFDFGFAKEVIDSEQRMTGNTGSLRYMAPEVNRYERYGLPADVYSFGVMLWEICSLKKPYKGMSVKEHSELVVKRGFRPKMSSVPGSMELQQIIRGCWASKADTRPTFREILVSLREVTDRNRQRIGRRIGK